ncbi:MAG: Rieske 2Fe-2S domain-containing protein [Verrucomicrobia bacterium]|nr:Rieske 2Fe-2S domain-containing protein [Verrucomicrobiota bacterium]
MENSERPPEPARRDFVKKAGSIVIGGLAGAIPTGAALTVFLDPLQRQGLRREFIHVASIDSLPSDGTPRQFSVVADRTDAWNKSPRVPIGAVYLRKTEANEVIALNVVCPHAGCFVEYSSAQKAFTCPCHNSRFGLDGTIADRKSPSPRALDALEVEIRNQSEIWVKFQNFVAGHGQKIPVA